MKGAGWGTEAVTAMDEWMMDRLFSYLRDGFERFNDYPHRQKARAEDVRRHAQTALGRFRDGRWFLWVHFFDPHDPYEAHPRFDFGSTPRGLYDAEVASVDEQLGVLR